MPTTRKQPKTIIDAASSDDNFSTLVSLLQDGDLVDTLKGKGPFTVFAPTNAAFENLPRDTREKIMNSKDKTRLQDLLKNHIVQGRRMAKDITRRSSISLMSGQTLDIRTKGDNTWIGDVSLQKTDLEAGNGVVHAIDQVLLP